MEPLYLEKWEISNLLTTKLLHTTHTAQHSIADFVLTKIALVDISLVDYYTTFFMLVTFSTVIDLKDRTTYISPL